jgi:DNA-binding response OmpR family regulator
MKEGQKKILLVDDEPHIVMALEYLLEEEGYDIAKAHDGESALAKAIEFIPDVIILDVMMPGLDGFSVAKEIRKNDMLAHTSIIFLTAKSTPEDKMTGYDSGGEYYLVKPFDNDDILEKVKEIISF